MAARGYCPGVSSWGHVEVAHISHVLPDGRTLLDDVSFRIGEGITAALVGPNGAGKTTLLRLVAGDLQPQSGTVAATGGLGVMRQFIGTNQGLQITPMVRDLLLSVSPPRVREAAARLDAAELAMMERDDERAQLRYAAALAEWGEAGGYDAEARLGARRRLPELRPGPRRPDQQARGAAPPLGRGAREAEGAGPHLAAEGLLQLRHGVPAAGRGDQAAQVRGGRAAAGRPAGAERQDAAARRADRQTRRHVREP